MNRSLRFCFFVSIVGCLAILGSTNTIAQIQRLISYQGLLTQPTGLPIADGQYGVVLRLYDAPVGGNLVYEETQQTQIVKGLFNVLIGQNIGLNAVDFFNNQYWLETALESQPPFPRTRLAVVPYAIRAERADKAGGLDDDATGFVRSLNGAEGDLVIKGSNGVSVSRTGDTIHVESTITMTGVQSLTSPENTIQISNPNGPSSTADVRDGAITTQKLGDASVTSIKIANNAVGTVNVTNGAITLVKIAPGVIPTSLPPSGPASGDLTGTYPAPLIANGAVTTPKIADNAITTPKLSDGSVTTPKLSDGSVTTVKIANGAVTSDKLSPTGAIAGTYGNETNVPQVTVDDKGRITGIVNKSLVSFSWIVPAGGDLTGTYPNPLIAPNAVTTTKILDGNVTTPKLADGAVTNVKIAGNSITGDKVVDGSLTIADLAPGTIPTTLPPSGPAGGELTGTYPNPIIQNGVITNAKIANGAVDGNKLADNSVTTAKILDGTIILADLAPGLIPTVFPPSGPAGGELTGTYPNPLIQNGVITTAKIANGAVDGTKLADNSVTSAKIVDGTIILADLAPGLIPTTLPPNGPAGGSLTGTYPNPTINPSAGNNVLAAINDGATTLKLADNRLNTTGVVAGTYGNGTTGMLPRFTVDMFGRISFVQEQAILSAQPSGPAGGDLTGTYPNPLINATSGAGNRIVDAVRADYLAVDPDINTPNNLVVLDAINRLPASNGSLITNLNAGAFTTGILPIERGGTNSGTALVGNRVMISSAGKIVETNAMSAGQLIIGTGAATPPSSGSVIAGPGISAIYTAPNITVASTDARVVAGSANNQTMRWDAALQSWVPNLNVLATSAGNLTSNGNLLINGGTDLKGNSDVGSNPGVTSTVGKGAGSTVEIGSATSTTAIRGTVNINTNVDANVSIGMPSSVNSSTTVSVGTSGNLTLNGIDPDTPYSFLSLNASSQVRQTLASTMALEGTQFQSGIFRLGGTSNTINPLLSHRYININNQQLSITSMNGTRTLMNINGGAGTLSMIGFVDINATGTDTTRIGNTTSKTTIGGELDPRGVIRNQTGSVVVLDQMEVYGQTQINTTTEENTFIGNAGGLGNQSTTLAVGQGAGGWLTLLNIKTDPTPIDLLSLDASRRVRRTSLSGFAREGLFYQNGAIRLGGPNTNDNPFLENRFVSLNASRLTFNRVNGTIPMMWLDAGLDEIYILGTTRINVLGNLPTRIGNPFSATFIGGPLTIDGATVINNTLNVAGAFGLSGALDVGGATTLNGTLDVDGATTLNNTLDVDGATTLNNTLDVDGATTLNNTLDVDGASTLNNTLNVTSNQATWVTTIENTNGGNGDGLLIKLGRTHGAWNGAAYIQIANPATIIAGSTLNTVRGWLNGASFAVSDLWTIFPGSAIAGALAAITNTVISEINDGLNLPLTIVPFFNLFPGYTLNIPDIPSLTVPDFGFGSFNIFPGLTLPDISIPSVNIGPYAIPAIPSIPTTGLPSIAIPDFRGTNVANSLTRENHYVTFQDKAGRQTGAIKAESVSEWRDNTVLDDVYLTTFAASWIGIDLLDAAVSGFTEIINLVASYNVIGVAYESGNGDYAEWLERENPDERIGPGDVVGVRGGKISKNTASAEQVMVVSHKPIVLGNMPEPAKRPFGNDVAFMGQVPVKVMGAVSSGDYLVAKGNIRGYAVSIHPSEMTPEDFTHAVGRSWDNAPLAGPKMVNTVIGVHNGEWAKVVRKLEQRQAESVRKLNLIETKIREKLGIEISTEEQAVRP